MKNKVDKDPFEAYDKFWDQLNEIEEIKSDDDYFKDKNNKEFKSLNQAERHKEQHNKMMNRFFLGFFGLSFFGFFTLFIFISNRPMMTIRFTFQSIILFIIFAGIILKIIKKLKY